jgi:hypothetical protein
MTAKIYVVRDKATGKVVRYVRSNTKNAAVRAHSEEKFAACPASTEEVFQAAKEGALKVLDACETEQSDMVGGQ